MAKKGRPARSNERSRAGAVPGIDSQAAVQLYRQRRPVYESLAGKVAEIIREVLEADGVQYHSVDWRAKEVISFERKAERYREPATEVHDLAGIRAIAYVESEARRIADIVRGLFEINVEHSEDKSLELGVDKMGYRSIHYVAVLPAERCSLPEFRRFAGMRFEIQVRTILQHAWAEIEHDRNYKFTGVLPPEIQRRFSLLAGVLEVADREFDAIAAEIDAYTGRVIQQTTAGDLDIAIDTISLRQYLLERFRVAVEADALLPTFGPNDDGAAEVVEELKDFGISSVAELGRLIPSGYEESVLEPRPHAAQGRQSFMGLVREVLMIADLEKYFERAWQGHWTFIHAQDERILANFGVDVVKLRGYLHRTMTPRRS